MQLRLIHTTTLKLHDFLEHAPKYAVLSHRWGAEELSYKDFRKGASRESEGHQKVLDLCKFARDRRLEWAWIDTCCIDKRSSAELSEAINSMW